MRAVVGRGSCTYIHERVGRCASLGHERQGNDHVETEMELTAKGTKYYKDDDLS